MSIREFLLPDPGEGLTEAEIVSWRVAGGDTVKGNDIVVEIETAKSLVELPIPWAGTVAALLVDEGAMVEVGSPIIAIDDPTYAGSAPVAPEESTTPAQADAAGADEAVGEGLIGGTTSTGRTAVLVGYGIKQTEAKRRPRRKEQLVRTVAAPPGEHVDSEPRMRMGQLVGAHAPEIRRDTRALTELAQPQHAGSKQAPVLAKPPVRKYAKDRGVDLAMVPAAGGTITREDIDAFLSGSAGAAGGAGAAAYDSGMPPAPTGPGGPFGGPSHPQASRGFAERGETRTPIKGVRKVTAAAMVGSAFTAPHVTEWITVDVTKTMELVDRLKSDREFRDVKVTPLLILAKAMCLAVRRHPAINAVWDDAAQEIVVKHYVNLGIAAATPRGLIVPNIKDADLMTLRELADALAGLTATARAGRTQPAEMSGGTITITNVGVFGVDTGSPIINPGESAIMAFGVIRKQPWVVTGTDESGRERDEIAIRHITTLALSFDHRLVDGELGSTYLASVAALMEDPARALVWG